MRPGGLPINVLTFTVKVITFLGGEFHKHRAGQLWNTIDERFMDRRFLPDERDDPEHPLYKLPRPLVRSSRPQADRKLGLDSARQ